MSLIRIDYENARAQARQLEQSEQQCSQIAQSIQALRQQLAGSDNFFCQLLLRRRYIRSGSRAPAARDPKDPG